MSIKQFQDELARGFRAPVYLLHAEDHYPLKEAALTIKRAIPEAERDFLYHAYDMDASDMKEPFARIVDVLRTVPLMGGKKTVAVENTQKLSAADLKTLARYVEAPSPDSVLLLLYRGAIKKTQKDSFDGIKAILLDIREADIPGWLKTKASERGLSITKEAIEYLLGTVGPDVGLLASEVEKLAMIGKKTIGRDEVAALARGSGDYDAWNLTDALESGDAARSLSICRSIAETQEPYVLLGALNWHYGKKRLPPRKRTAVFAILNEADRMLKSTGGTYPMEYLIVRLLRV